MPNVKFAFFLGGGAGGYFKFTSIKEISYPKKQIY
jgi:hypothetical protein